MPQAAMRRRRCIRRATTMRLNDDVLRESFHNLNSFEMCTLLDICLRNPWNAPAEFSLRLKDKDFVVYDGNGRKNKFHIRHLKPILRKFGPSINSVDISLTSMHRNNSARVLRVLTKYCVESLIELELRSFVFNASAIRGMQPMLSRLHVLKLYVHDTVRSHQQRLHRKCSHSVPSFRHYRSLDQAVSTPL